MAEEKDDSYFDMLTSTLSLAADYEINRIKAKAEAQKTNSSSPAYNAANDFDKQKVKVFLGMTRNQLMAAAAFFVIAPASFFALKKVF